MDSSGLSALSHCLHPTGRHAKCLGFLLECGADPNMRVSERDVLSSLPVTSSSSLLSPPSSFPISHFFSIPYLSSLTPLLSSTHSLSSPSSSHSLSSPYYSQDGSGLPILCAVCAGGFDKQLEKLLEKGADPNAKEPVSFQE